jgi:DNA-binding LytR/AlgR family response regulator
MNVLIIEDEDPAAERLQGLLLEAEPQTNVLATLDSVRSAVAWLTSHPEPDLIFLDIQLADGLSFEIFRQTEVHVPIVFTTAYDSYALEAFRVNSIDYLLKPVKREELTRALNKFRKTRGSVLLPDLGRLLQQLQPSAPVREFKRRFIIRFGDKIKAVDVDQVAYFYTEDKINFLRTRDNQSYPIDQNLDRLEELLDPRRFFRINRQFIISIDSIDQMYAFSKSRVKITLRPPSTGDTIVSTERSPVFKQWLAGES